MDNLPRIFQDLLDGPLKDHGPWIVVEEENHVYSYGGRRVALVARAGMYEARLSVEGAQPVDRAKYLGGMDVAAILGKHPYCSAVTVWGRKLGLFPDQPDNDRMEAGRLMEPAVFEMFKSRFKGEILSHSQPGFCKHPEHAMVGGTPDYVVETDKGQAIIECKIVFSWQSAKRWEEAGVLPPEYVCQLAYYREILGIERGYFAALVQGDMQIHECHMDDAGRKLGKYLVRTAVAFWEKYVLTERRPRFDGSEDAGSALKQLYPENTDDIRVATDAEYEDIKRLRSIKAEAKRVVGIKKHLEQRVKGHIASCDGIQYGDQKPVTWKANKRGVRSLNGV